MTYHEELAPRRGRSWLIATPLIFMLALSAAWSALWFYASGEAEARIKAWQTQQAAAGRTFACGNQEVGGFPFRIEVRCTSVNVVLNDAKPPVAIKLNEILVVTQVWQPTMLIAEFKGPLVASDPGQPPYLTGAWTLAQASVRGTPSAPERASISIDGLKLDGAVPNAPPLLVAQHAEFHARVQFGSWPQNPAIDLASKLVAATSGLHPLTGQPFDADVLAVLHGMKDFVMKPLPVRLREWQAAGGRLEIQNARLAQGDALVTATGLLALTQRGRLDGNLQLSAANVERLLPTLTGGKAGPAMALDRTAPALNAIDRAIPGLSVRIAPQQQQSLGAGLLALFGKPVDVEGKRGVSLPVKFSDGNATLGPIPLGQVPPVF